MVDSGKAIKLVIDKPSKAPAIPEEYTDAKSVSFSMKLENVKNSHELQVPVEITLPVPEDLRSGPLYILHYDAEGNYVRIRPKTYTENGCSFARFVLAGFSDFVMLSGTSEKGDINLDGYVNDEDVILLLWHTLLPDLYPIEADGDINGDDYVNDEDVILLLWHTLLPDLYPI